MILMCVGLCGLQFTLGFGYEPRVTLLLRQRKRGVIRAQDRGKTELDFVLYHFSQALTPDNIVWGGVPS